MLIDTGYAGNDGRDAKRIVAAANSAGVKKIDHLVVTHYHGDHAGGVAQLAEKMPIGKIYDHGDAIDKQNQKTIAVYEPYRALRTKYQRKALKVGDKIPLAGVLVEVVASAGQTISNPLLDDAGKPNAACESVKPLPPDEGENAKSLAMIITFGKLRIADLGDLFWNQELELACPTNLLGKVDLYMTTHHGTATSGSEAIVHALHPKVAIMNNGADKGGSIKALKAIKSSPDLEGLWQLHFSNEAGKDHNTVGNLIANPSPDNDQGFAIEVTARPDGTFTVRNNRNQLSKSY